MSGLASPAADDLAALAAIVGQGGAVDPASDAAAPYLVEPRDRYRGQAAAILKPATTAEVTAIVRHCARRRLGVVPYAGGTG